MWLFQDSIFEKMGMHMAKNGGRLLGMFDELSAFLTKIKLYSSCGLTDLHEILLFLELYNGNSWNRTTGKCTCSTTLNITHVVCTNKKLTLPD